jgi:hypothetical protein
MKMTFFAVLAGAVIAATGCVKTVSDTNSMATTWSQDTITGRYNRSPDQVYQAALVVVSQNGMLVKEYIPHGTTNATRSIEGKVNQRNVWVRVTAVDPRVTQVEVQSRSSWGVSDVTLSAELEKLIALQLAR